MRTAPFGGIFPFRFSCNFSPYIATPLPDQPNRTLKAYANRLANLSGQNKALLFLRPSSQQDLDLLDLDFAAGKPAIAILQELIEGKTKVALCSTGLGGGRDGELSQRLKNLARKTQSVAEETGSQDLHLGWPLATGRWSNDGLVRAPLLLWPVRIWQQSGTWYLAPQPDEGPAFNKAFLLAMAHYNQVPMPTALLDEDFEEAPSDWLAFRTWLYEKLKAAELPLSFNQDLFYAPLQPLRAYKRAELEAETQTGNIKLMPEAVLGLFPQADSYMGQDYDLMQANGITLEEVLGRRGSPFGTVYPAWPLAVDGSQEKLLGRLRQGESLCVQGPPGTGKSQLIANLTADALAAGKRVLVVCQKRAALEVVQQRLADVGLGAWLAPVYDFRADRGMLYERISAQIDALAEFDGKAATLQQSANPADFTRLAHQLAQADAELEELRRALFTPGPSGLPGRTLYLELKPGSPRIDLGPGYAHFTFPEAEGYCQTLARLDVLRKGLAGVDRFWNLRLSLAKATGTDAISLQSLLQDWPSQQAALIDVAAKPKLTPKEARRWITRLGRPGFVDGLKRASTALGDAEVLAVARLLAVRKERKFARKLLWKVRRYRADQIYKLALPDERLQAALAQMVHPDPKRLLKCVDEAIVADGKGVFGWLHYRTLGSGSQPVVTLAKGTGSRTERLAQTRQGLEAANRLLALRRVAVGRLPMLESLLPADPGNQAGWQRGLDILLQAATVARFFHRAKLGKSVRKVFFKDSLTRKAYLDRVSSAANGLIFWGQNARKYLAPAQISALFDGKVDAAQAAASLRQHYDSLVECDRITGGLGLAERSALRRMLGSRLALGKAGSLEGLFRQSLLAAWLNHTEQAMPALRLAAGTVLDLRRQEVLRSLRDRRNLATAQILLRLMAEAQHATQDARKLKELAHQVRKKRQLWSIRRLLDTYFEQVVRLAPCWMASPETVSAILPFSEGLFDLVVFDEASQCFAERGIPAAWRGSQLMITGDSKQLPPFDLYRVRFADEEDAESADTEADSLLTLAGLHLPEAGLESHYRSRRPELIEFSNRHFYKGRLLALPEQRAMAEGAPALTVTRVAGHWHNRQNQPEAEAVVAAVLQHLAEHPEQTLGVVTFNQPQQVLILDLLDELAAQKGIVLPTTLFVKNIENVQGDERDHIYFSLGYGPDEQGKIRLQFGSLSMKGGENRLNVAITRARMGVRLFASLSANDLARAATGAEGAKLLAAYLAYAEQISQGQAVFEVMAKEPPQAGTLAYRLAAREATLSAAMPFADLTRFDNGVPAGLVFTDDAAFQTAPTAREYVVMRPEQARRLGWKVEQRWSREEAHLAL